MQQVSSASAPQPVGPYSQAVQVGGVLYVSGQIALHPATGQMVQESIQAEALQVFRNMEQVLLAGGSSLLGVVKVTVLLASMDDFAAVNEVYAKQFQLNPVLPARTTFAVLGLPKGARVELDCVAVQSAIVQ